MKRFCALFLLILVLLLPAHTEAMEPVRFHAPQNNKELFLLEQLKDKLRYPLTKFHIGTIDLNHDAIDEYFLRIHPCPPSEPCKTFLVAIKDNKPIILNHFNIIRVFVSDNDRYGVRDIIISENKSNDYNKNTYMWSPENFSYVPKMSHP